MLEMLINPKKAERKPWELFFVGLLYASLSILLVHWIFGQDPVLSEASGILVVTFTVMFSLPFIFYTLKYEEKKAEEETSGLSLLKEHKRAIMVFLWLFLGFLVAYAFWNMILTTPTFNFQIKTYCQINQPGSFESCVQQYGLNTQNALTGNATSGERFLSIFTNNIYVLIFTLIFSLIFGAGAIFILAWNASVIAAAIGIFTKSDLTLLPLGLARYMIHGLPEIAAYFIVALAGGLVSVAVIKHEFGTPMFWDVLQDSLNLIILSVVVLLIAGLIEVFITPVLFN